MSRDINSLGLSVAQQDMLTAGDRLGISARFYKALANDKGLFRYFAGIVCGPDPEAVQQGSMALKQAVERGVRYENGVYHFFDPGFSVGNRSPSKEAQLRRA